MLHSLTVDIREARRVAAHESGHAIARWAVGAGIDSITIVSNGQGVNGRVVGDADDDFDRIIILSAGRAGERAHLGEADDIGGSDLRKAEAVARLLAPNSSVAREYLLDAATREARAIMPMISEIAPSP